MWTGGCGHVGGEDQRTCGHQPDQGEEVGKGGEKGGEAKRGRVNGRSYTYIVYRHLYIRMYVLN